MINRNISTGQVSGTFKGPRGMVGHTLQGNIAQTSGTTYGGQGLGYYWQQYPGVVAGRTEYDPQATLPGSNLEAFVQSTENALGKVGGGVQQAEVPDYGGTAAY